MDSKLIKGSLNDTDPKIFKKPLKFDDLVYSRERYIEGQSPMMLYIPRKEIMF